MENSSNTVGFDTKNFGILDYSVFIAMLVISGLIGVYFGFFKKSVSKAEYLVGGRNMTVFPVSMSLVATWVSGISLLGIPTEMYFYGVQYAYFGFALIIMGIVMNFAYLPVFHNLKLTSTYEYLEMRFDNRVRILGSLLFAIANMTWLPIVVYVPALAFNQVTGVNIHYVTPAVCIVCIFYTCVGGLKAVVWTDVVQSVIMYGVMILIVIKGTMDVGGFSVVWQRNYDSTRIELPNFDMDFTARYTFWAVTFGGFSHWLTTNAINQSMMQRYLCLPTLSHARKALIIFILAVSVLLLLCCYSGLLTYATYYDCDPITTQVAKAKDQLLPLLAVNVLGNYPGATGLFISAVFSAALSSMSSGLNSVTAVVREDFYNVVSSRPLTEKQSDTLMKTVVVIAGAICIGLVFVVERLGSVFQLSSSFSSMSQGPTLGLFTTGIFFPFVTPTAALWGGACALVFMSWICIGAQTALATGVTVEEYKPLTIEGCTYNFTYHPQNITHHHESDVFPLYQVSYMWYTLIGCLVTVAVSLFANIFVDKRNTKKIGIELLSPVIRPFIQDKEKNLKMQQMDHNGYKYSSVELQTVKEP